MSLKPRGLSGLERILNCVARPVQLLTNQVLLSGGSSAAGARRRFRFSPQLETLETREVLSPAIGMNLEQISDYMAAWMFTDAFKAAGRQSMIRDFSNPSWEELHVA